MNYLDPRIIVPGLLIVFMLGLAIQSFRHSVLLRDWRDIGRKLKARDETILLVRGERSRLEKEVVALKDTLRSTQDQLREAQGKLDKFKPGPRDSKGHFIPHAEADISEATQEAERVGARVEGVLGRSSNSKGPKGTK